ncbi:sensor histidine kinase [Ovoidimarina sediminis]|uniref:sensor histidine kinase n=1 Tax=Ovoidimarina sediminis TaxID=3079856 RepID=UPI0029065E0B|nr:ATP-binding protein [Rhodophyticola sp. MJ-SS7]MDU8945458.1 ATP-binding protein [Rhodophyticola sp. MJ-SS7]
MPLKIGAPNAQDRTFSDQAWGEVLEAVDKAYAELVTYQERLERQNEELHEFQRFVASILSSVSDIMIVVGRGNRIEEVSASLSNLTGQRGDALIGSDATDLFSPESRDRFNQELEALRFSRDPARFEALLGAGGDPEPYDISITARVDDRGRMIGAVIVGRPLGELRRAYQELEDSHRSLKEAQAQLVRNEKLASLGRLLAGVAHELNNPISFVYANAHALEKYIGRFEAYFERVEAGAPREELVALRQELKLERELRNLRGAIDGARDGAERVRDIVADLRRLTVAGGVSVESFDLVEAARVAARWVCRGSKTGAEVRFEGSQTLRILGNQGHVQQIIMNLIQNAIDAVEGQTDPDIWIEAAEEDGMAVLKITDNGPGIPSSAAASIFDPFFTTKPVGKGTGLGLSISNKIAEEHGGRLHHVPREDGTSFRLELPLEKTA